jgi:isopenicillin N synthase-like dioxygenase
MGELPIVSVSGWKASVGEPRQAAAHDVDEALCDFGFLLISDHGVSDEVAAAVRGAAHRFFGLDETIKDECRTRVGGRGWIPPGAESNSYASGVAAPPDLKETFKVGLTQRNDPTQTQPDVWPSSVPDLESFVRAYVDQVWALAVDLFTLFEEALSLPEGTFTGPSSRAASSLNLNYYPSLRVTGEPKAGQFRIGAHSDFGFLTILDRQVGYGGLQIQTRDGSWIDAPLVPGALTVNVGDMLARWTGDRWRSTMHRVLPPSPKDQDESLLSLVNFCGVAPSTLVHTLPVGGPSRYDPVLAGDYMRSKLASIDVLPSTSNLPEPSGEHGAD